ncbi:flavin containing amine oxidoreductase [Hirsutella rhossiliensis]|uniref:Protoporphyrinogen oxidase n=1 Tax=Hirsutella rhossiliensis TaxID=111463 RepID=A0A9P8MQE5_9HYPO|nr:flavin containing amine oxidoreductase domain-containing protein [Hirsutella rhossiliensis]KAH0957327.1 flavin containing amine oxidoreductase domain-containing protein [Hirsutella rhossiliensis]
MGRRRAEDAAAAALLRLAGPGTRRGACRRDGPPRRWLSVIHGHRRHPRECGRGFVSRRAPGIDVAAARGYATAEDAARRIAVVGGGLTGLTTAYYLARMLPPTVGITLYESSGRLGGWIKTDRVPVDVDGTRGTVSFERGPRTLSSLHNNKWRFDDLILYDLALDLGLPISTPEDQPRYIYYPDHLVPLPPAVPLLNLVREPLFLDSMWGAPGYLLRRMLRDGKLPPDDHDPSIADWLHHITMSRSVADNMASAMVHGIYGGDIDKLSARSVLDRFYWNYHVPKPYQDGSLMLAREHAILEVMSSDEHIRKLALRPKGSLLHFGPAGMEALTTALANALQKQPNVNIEMDTSVRSISYDHGEQKVNVIASKSPRDEDCRPVAYDRVISTLLSHDLARITGDSLPSLSEKNTVSLLTVNMWYPRQNLKPRGFGYLIPRSVPHKQNPERALGVFFDSDVGVAGPDEPAGTKLFVLMGGHYYESDDPHAVSPPGNEGAAIAQAQALLERHLGIPRATPCFAMARMAPNCIPQHWVGHRARMARAHGELLAAFGGRLVVAGGSYTNVGAMAGLRAGCEVAGLAADSAREGTGLEQFTESEDILCVPSRKIPVRRARAGV